MKLRITFGILFLLTTACTHSVHVDQAGDFSPYSRFEDGKMIQTEKEQLVVLGITQDTSYVNAAYNDLARQCPKGQVLGVNVRYSTSHGFFSWTNKILMQGICVSNNSN